MKKDQKVNATALTPKRSFMYFVLDRDQSENPMPPEAAESILKRILSFFLCYHKEIRRDENGKN